MTVITPAPAAIFAPLAFRRDVGVLCPPPTIPLVVVVARVFGVKVGVVGVNVGVVIGAVVNVGVVNVGVVRTSETVYSPVLSQRATPAVSR
jgi:uncharacterized membrane protein YdjX (TVP38/TMEM64 family)